jgi:hypothetical protein
VKTAQLLVKIQGSDAREKGGVGVNATLEAKVSLLSNTFLDRPGFDQVEKCVFERYWRLRWGEY